MLYNIVSLINAATWLVCTLSISAESQSWIHTVDHFLLVLCLVLDVIVLTKGKYEHFREKLTMILFTVLALIFLVCDIYFET